MSAAIFVEILSRNGEVEQRYRLTELPIRIGRSYQNEIILDDEHTAPEHAVLEHSEDGVLQIRDLGSRNGIIHAGKRQASLHLDGHQVVRLGQTHLRVRDAQFSVEAEKIDANNYHWEGLRPALTGVLLIFFLAIGIKWLVQTESFSLTVYVQYTLSLFVFALLWSGIWAGANRLFARHPRFGRHLFTVACGMWALQTWETVSSVLAFMFSWEFLTRYSNHVEILIFAFVLHFHLNLINPRHSRRKLFFTLFCASLASGTLLMSKYKNTGAFSDELYMGHLYSPALHLSRDLSIDEFINDAEKLKAQVDLDGKNNVPVADDDEE